MRKLLRGLWADDGGQIISIELLFIIAILIIGLVAGWAGLRAAVVTEFTETGNAVLALNQAYEFEGISGVTGGSGNPTIGGFTIGGVNLVDVQEFLPVVFRVAPVTAVDNTTLIVPAALSP